MSNCSKAETQERRKKVKELVLKGVLDTKMLSKTLGVTSETINKDLNYLNAYYSKLALNNPHIAERQYARMMRLVDETDLIKKEYWEILKDLKDDKTPENKTYIDWLESASSKLKIIQNNIEVENLDTAINKIDNVIARLSLIKKKHIGNRLSTLSGLIQRALAESKLLNMYNPQTVINNNYITIDNLEDIIKTIKGIINDFVPIDKKKYAYERLKKMSIKTQTGEDIIDAEIVG